MSASQFPPAAAPEIAPGEIGVGIGAGEQKDRILLVLPKPQKWVALQPEQACAIAKDMIDKAVQMGYRVEIVVPRKPISSQTRTRIVNRLQLVMQSMLSEKKDPRYVAEELTDIVLRDSGA